MNNILLNISSKINQNISDAFNKIKMAADSLEIPFFIIGASARDFILDLHFQLQTPRKTNDIDLGIGVTSWDEYERLINILLLMPDFKKDKEKQRLFFKDIPIDLIPFGKISNREKNILWPPENNFIMSTLGFEEVYKHSLTIRVKESPPLDIKIASLQGLVILKLFSWKEKYPTRSKDAEDLIFIIDNYHHTIECEYVYTKGLSILKEENFDYEACCLRLLGKEIASICDIKLLKQIKDILFSDNDLDHLIINMSNGISVQDSIYEKVKRKLLILRNGIFADKNSQF